MKNNLLKTTFLFVLLLFILSVSAQTAQDSIKSRIETIDGNEFIGIILDRTTDHIKLKTDRLGEISILKTDIKKISEITTTQAKDGTYWFDNPQSTRYFWSPNGYNLKKGEGYYQNVWIFFNQAIYGFTDHFSAGVGTMPMFLFGGTATPAWVTLKYSVPVVKNKVNLGGGALMATVIGEGGFGGILYGISTFGSRDNNLNLGLGYAFGGGEIASTPLFTFGGMIRTGSKGYLITENYFVVAEGEFGGMMMFGGRRIIKNFGLDFGLITPFGAGLDGLWAFPWLGFTVPFGSKQKGI